MTAALVVQIISAAMQLAPLAVTTIQGILGLLSKDPAIPADLQAILQSTANDNATTLANVQAWLAKNQGV